MRLESADVEAAIDDTGQAALIGRGIRGTGVAGADGRAAGQECQGLSGPAVVAERRQAGVVAEDVAGAGRGVIRGVLDGRPQQVVAAIGRDAAVDVGPSTGGPVSGHDRVPELSVPPLLLIPPPEELAVLPESVVLLKLSVPPSFSIPPPEPVD